MAMTASVKDELSRLYVNRPCCRKAEVSAILRFAGGLHINAGKISIEVEFVLNKIVEKVFDIHTLEFFLSQPTRAPAFIK